MTKANLTLSYTDGRPSTIGIAAVNRVLRAAGVRVSQTPVPAEAYPILEASKTRDISEDEQAELISKFSLDRNGLLEQIQLAGHTPEVRDGGNLNTSEHNVAPYPKVYDMQAVKEVDRKVVLARFGRLHVNTADEGGIGIDEVMTVVSGGPLTWFFRLPDGIVAKLSVPSVEIGDQAWRLSYPGKRPHGAFLDAQHGLFVAYAHGPKEFVVRYESSSAEGAAALGTNPWIDFGGNAPRMLDNVSP